MLLLVSFFVMLAALPTPFCFEVPLLARHDLQRRILSGFPAHCDLLKLLLVDTPQSLHFRLVEDGVDGEDGDVVPVVFVFFIFIIAVAVAATDVVVVAVGFLDCFTALFTVFPPCGDAFFVVGLSQLFFAATARGGPPDLLPDLLPLL